MKETQEVKVPASTKHLLFQLRKELFALHIDCVTVLLHEFEITVVPSQPEYIRGIIEHTGGVIPVIDAGQRLLKDAICTETRTSVIVVTLEDGSQYGLMVDSNCQLLDITEEDYYELPELGRDPAALRMVKSAARITVKEPAGADTKKLVLVLDPAVLASGLDFEAIAEIPA